MKVGILNAIPPELSKVNWQGSPVDAYIRFFKGANDTLQFVGYQVTAGDFPESPEACDAYVITGSPKGAYENDPWITELIEFIRASFAAGKKLMGICFGHQVLAHALGGRTEKSEKGWGLGLKTFSIESKNNKPWLNGNSGSCSLYFAHQDQVVELPPNAELLGGNDFCPNAFYTIEDQVLGIQGHPEFSTQIMTDILTLAVDDLDPAVHQEAVKSMDKGAPEGDLVARWMVDFLTA